MTRRAHRDVGTYLVVAVTNNKRDLPKACEARSASGPTFQAPRQDREPQVPLRHPALATTSSTVHLMNLNLLHPPHPRIEVAFSSPGTSASTSLSTPPPTPSTYTISAPRTIQGCADLSCHDRFRSCLFHLYCRHQQSRVSRAGRIDQRQSQPLSQERQ